MLFATVEQLLQLFTIGGEGGQGAWQQRKAQRATTVGAHVLAFDSGQAGAGAPAPNR